MALKLIYINSRMRKLRKMSGRKKEKMIDLMTGDQVSQ